MVTPKGGAVVTAKPSITLKAASVSRCVAAQEMAVALQVLKEIAARLDASQEKPAQTGNEGV